MKVFSLSQRFHYKNDLILYNAMIHKTFKRTYDHSLSAIYEAKTLIKSLVLTDTETFLFSSKN